MKVINSIRPCTREERETWLRHQRSRNPNTGEWLLALYGATGAIGLMDVTGGALVGSLTSFFKRSDGRIGASTRITIREALDLFTLQASAADSDGIQRHDKIRSYVARSRQAGSEPIVTAVAFTDGLIVVDGNHTAMAACLRAAESESEPFVFPMFILSTDTSSAVLG